MVFFVVPNFGMFSRVAANKVQTLCNWTVGVGRFPLGHVDCVYFITKGMFIGTDKEREKNYHRLFPNYLSIIHFQLLNLHGKTLVCYVISLLLAYMALAQAQFHTNEQVDNCYLIGKHSMEITE